ADDELGAVAGSQGRTALDDNRDRDDSEQDHSEDCGVYGLTGHVHPCTSFMCLMDLLQGSTALKISKDIARPGANRRQLIKHALPCPSAIYRQALRFHSRPVERVGQPI